MARENTLGVVEVVDTLRKFAELEIYIYDQLADGFQLVDVFTAGLKAYPTIEEAIRDGGTFWAEAKNVFLLEGVKVYQDVSGSFSEADQARSRIIALVKLLATGYVLIDDTVRRLDELKDLAVDIAK